MTKYEAVLADASQLPIADRIDLIEALWDTMSEEELPPLSDEWLAEIERRSADYVPGVTPTHSWEEVKAEAMQHLQRKVD